MTHRALLVGINAYPGQPLDGRVNDVNDMAGFIVDHCGFESSDIRLLADARATTANIKTRLEWLSTGIKKGDRVLFHYSGHGARFPIRDRHGKVVAVHDTICPVDFDWTRERAMLDDDIRKLVDKAPAGVDFIYVSDSCNSGDLTRAYRAWRPKVFQAPADIAWRLRTASDDKLKMSAMPHDRCGLISGCKSTQESADAVFGGRPNGALTYFLLKALKAKSGLSTPLTKLVPAVVTRLKQHGYDQQPQLRGPDYVTSRAFLK